MRRLKKNSEIDQNQLFKRSLSLSEFSPHDRLSA
jgi:hypothetical protein